LSTRGQSARGGSSTSSQLAQRGSSTTGYQGGCACDEEEE
jgi:hypothetical protein